MPLVNRPLSPISDWLRRLDELPELVPDPFVFNLSALLPEGDRVAPVASSGRHAPQATDQPRQAAPATDAGREGKRPHPDGAASPPGKRIARTQSTRGPVPLEDARFREVSRLRSALRRLDFDDLIGMGPNWTIAKINERLEPEARFSSMVAFAHLDIEIANLVFERASMRTPQTTNIGIEPARQHVGAMIRGNEPVGSKFDILLGLNKRGFNATPPVVNRAAIACGLNLPMFREGQPRSEFGTLRAAPADAHAAPQPRRSSSTLGVASMQQAAPPARPVLPAAASSSSIRRNPDDALRQLLADPVSSVVAAARSAPHITLA